MAEIKQSSKFQLVKLSVVLATILTIAINLISDIIPIGGKTTAQISDSFKVFFVPAGYVFAIWGVIYIGWIAYSYYQLKNDSEKLRRVAPWYLLSALANSVWIILWHYELFLLTVIVMLILLVSLIAIYLVIHKEQPKSKSENYMLYVPFSIYLGWISVATIANITDYLKSINWNGAGVSEVNWSVIVMIVAGILGILALNLRKDYVYALVIIWALVGVAYKFSSIEVTVSTVATVVAVLVSFMLLIKFFKKAS